MTLGTWLLLSFFWAFWIFAFADFWCGAGRANPLIATRKAIRMGCYSMCVASVLLLAYFYKEGQR